MRKHWCSGLALLVVAACGGGGSPPPPSSPGGPQCELGNAGPLVGWVYQAGPAPIITGGDIRDGDYDLTNMMFFGRQGSEGKTAFLRWAMRFRTQERSPNHTEGTIATTFEVAPQSQCMAGRFATTGTEMRIAGFMGQKGIESARYSVTPEGFIMIVQGGSAPTYLDAYFFRRR